MTLPFKSASNPHAEKIAPYAETLHALARDILHHDEITSRYTEMMQVAGDNPQRYQEAVNLAAGSFADGYVDNRYSVEDDTEQRFGCLPLKAVMLEDAMDVLGEDELSKLVPIDLAFCTQEMVDAFEACQLKGFKRLFETVGIANGIAVRREPAPVAAKPAAKVVHMAAVLV